MKVTTLQLLGITMALAFSTASHAQQQDNTAQSPNTQEVNPAVSQIPANPEPEFDTIYRDKVGQIDLILHKRLIETETRTLTEDELMIMVRSKPSKTVLSSLMTVASIASSIKNGQIPVPLKNLFGNEQVKAAKLEPEFKNPTLDHARPLFSQWLQTHATQFAPADKPLKQVSIESNRFVLLNGKKLKKTDYQLYNEIHITLQNEAYAYTHKCEMLSAALTIDDWQAEQYQAVNQAVQSNLQQCIADLDKSKKRIFTALTPTA